MFLFLKAMIILSNKESGLKVPGFGLPSEWASILFPPCGSLLEWWSVVKYQTPSTKTEGLRCRVSGVRCQEKDIEAET
jgi:hypothetical protein